MKNNTVIYNDKEYNTCICMNNGTKLLPFHNDLFMIEIMLNILKESEVFIETGTAGGQTIFFVARNFQELECYTCEVSKINIDIAAENIKGLTNVKLMNIKSPDALYYIKNNYNENIFEKKICFWLDAHGGAGDFPLNEEIIYITSNFKDFTVFIDDFAIPWDNSFTHDGFHIDNIKESINNKEKFKYYMPNYSSLSPECNNINNQECCKPVGYLIITTNNLDKYSFLKEINL